MEEYMLPCLSKKFFGMECMGCGSQRALVMVFKGDFLNAFHMFPAIYSTLIFFLFVALHFIDKTRSYHKLIIYSAIINAVIMVVAFLIKISNY
ncbi:DUF2752 domain-containing protein [Flavobacterium qiangtangense]|uniref:DUF2752 domain-containing protein n=1 Tax=Flavobacterium qiangtangense TaxID=1442595 RepID=A0ABW1PJB3_9FLAO